MHQAADDLDFETAAKLRDRIVLLQERAGLKPLAEWKPRRVQRGRKWRTAARDLSTSSIHHQGTKNDETMRVHNGKQFSSRMFLVGLVYW